MASPTAASPPLDHAILCPDRRWAAPASVAGAISAAAATWLLPGHPTWPLALASAGLVGVVGAGVARIGSGVFGQVVVAGRPGRGLVSLTFDDGPDAETTPRIADMLARRGHRATFFVVGERVRGHPELVRELLRGGHDLGIHSDDHSLRSSVPAMGWLERDFRRAGDAVTDVAGRRPLLYRPPVGLMNPRIQRVAARGGWTIVGWTLRPRDGVRAKSAAVARRVIRGLADGAIVLLHDHLDSGVPASLGALPAILAELERRGWRSVALSELLGRPAFRDDSGGGPRDAGAR